MHCLQQEFSTLLSSFALATIVFEQKSTGQYELEAFSSTSLQILGFLNRPTTDEMLDRLALNNLSDSLFPLTYMLPATEGRSVASQGMVCRSEDEHFLLVLLCKAEEVKTQYDMLFTLDDQFTVEKVEGLSLVQHLRLPLSEVVGMQFSSFFDAQTAGDLHRLLERAKSTHSKQSIFYQSPLSGDVRYLKATASYDQQKGCFLVGVDNISAQLGLVLQHETTEAEGLLIAEDDEQRSEACRIVYADANAETLLEQSKAQLLGTPLDGLFASESLTDSSLIRYVSPGGNQKQFRLVTEQFSDYRLLRISQWGRASKKVGWINLLLQLSFELLQASSEVIEPTMQSILERLGQFSASDRVYIFECSSDCTSVSNTYEWCAPEVGSQKASLQQNDCSLFPRWMETLMHGQEIYIVQVQNLPDSWEAERAILLDQQIQSVLVEPIMASKQLFGFIGFDSVHSPKDWPQEVRELLLYFANILGAFFSRTSTEQQLAQALKTTTDLAATREQQNRSLSAFYAKMSHDIRNALYAITGSSEQLLQTLLAPQAQSAASMIHSNAVFVSHLIQDLLDFSTVSDQPLLLRSEPFSFPDVFSRSVAAVTLLASEKQLTINTIHDDTIPTTLLGDEVRLSQILINLLHNAIKFTD